MSRKYQLVLESSLVDEEFAPDLIRTITENATNGTIDAELTLVANLATNILKGRFEHYDEKDFYRRWEYVRSLVKNSIFFNSDEFHQSGKGWRSRHDEALKGILSDIKPDSVLDVGYMLLISEILWQAFPTVNLHPAIPRIGPVGTWPEVMREQAERPLEEIGNMEFKGLSCPREKIADILNKREYRAGGMLLLVDDTIDRGPPVSYYEFPLTSPELLQLFWVIARTAGNYGIEKARNTAQYGQLVKVIRNYQYPGEKPLIIHTYNRLTHGRQKIEREDGLWVPHPGKYCLNQEVGEWLKESGIVSLIE